MQQLLSGIAVVIGILGIVLIAAIVVSVLMDDRRCRRRSLLSAATLIDNALHCHYKLWRGGSDCTFEQFLKDNPTPAELYEALETERRNA